MCAKCVEIDKRIEHFKKLHERLLEAQTLRSIEILIEELEAKKASLHPEGVRRLRFPREPGHIANNACRTRFLDPASIPGVRGLALQINRSPKHG
jgi:hypothetical protein